MAVQMDSGGNDVKTQFITREGTYRLMTLSEYSRPNRVGYTNNQGSSQVRVSFVTLPDPTGNGDRLCFNYGKELYVYVYKGVKKAADLTKPVDKKMYKGTNPTCHDFNSASVTSDSVSLLIGFSTGQIQLIDPIKKELSKLFNEERLIDKTKVTCIHWVPGSSNLFLVSHASGQLYVYNEELMCGTTPPNYQPFKQGEGYAIHTCKTKSTRNPLYRWVIGNEGCCINEFAFSPCGANLAVVSQDGFLRVFHYDTMELIGLARSYFGGFLCVCWSPDGRYIVVGGEDDLVTVWSLHERRVVARGQGHRSWVSVVAFDPYTTSYNDTECHEFSGSDDESQQTTNNRKYTSTSASSAGASASAGTRNSGDYTTTSGSAACYRLGSVSQDTQLCLWDITEDVLNQPVCTKNRAQAQPHVLLSHSGSFLQSRNNATKNDNKLTTLTNNSKVVVNSVLNSVVVKDLTSNNSVGPEMTMTATTTTMSSTVNTTVNSLTQRLTNLSFGDKKSSSTAVENTHKRNFSLGSKSSSGNSDSKNNFSNTVTLRTKNNSSGSSSNNQNSNNCVANHAANDMYDPLKLIGTASCPRFDECPVLEPLICKKIAHERLTALVFREDCLVTACQDGYVYTWARPGKMNCNGGAYPRSEPD